MLLRAAPTRRLLAGLALLFAVAAGMALVAGDTSDLAQEPISALCRDDARAAATSDPAWRTDPGRFIAHGGGGIDGAVFTDSLEAVMASIGRGYRLIELDLQVTADGHLVAVHDWKSFRQRTGRETVDGGNLPLSLAEFKARAIDGRYTPLDEEAIRTLFLGHPHLVLVVDKTRDFTRLVRAFPFQERMIVEVFSADDVALAKSSGVVNPMLSIGSLESSLPLILKLPIRHVALSTHSLRRCPGAARKIIESGRQVFLFTTDDAAFMGRHVGSHVTAFYTDFWHVKLGRCDGPACPVEAQAAGDGR